MLTKTVVVGQMKTSLRQHAMPLLSIILSDNVLAFTGNPK